MDLIERVRQWNSPANTKVNAAVAGLAGGLAYFVERDNAVAMSAAICAYAFLSIGAPLLEHAYRKFSGE